MIKTGNLIQLIISFILVALIYNGLKSSLRIKNSVRKVDRAQEEIALLAKENENLKQKIEETKSDEYIEKEALEKLNLTKPGYRIVVIDPLKPTIKEVDNVNTQKETRPPEPNWRLWLKFFNF